MKANKILKPYIEPRVSIVGTMTETLCGMSWDDHADTKKRYEFDEHSDWKSFDYEDANKDNVFYK